MTIGTLVLVGKNKNLQVKFTNANGKEVYMPIPEAELSAPVVAKKRNAIAQLEGLEVELEVLNGQPKQVREKGKIFERPQANNAGSRQQQAIQRNPNPLPNRMNNATSANIRGDFHNPYNFIPAPPRKTDHPTLGDSRPVGHGCYHNNYWSGKITVTLTTVTPLLIPDAANLEKDDKGHKTYPVRVGVDGKPYLPPTSIKGMLRSAYEAVTNSRFGIFEKHNDRLAYRMEAKVTNVPARVERQGESLVLRIMEESSLLGNAAKLPRYQKPGSPPDKGERTAALKYDQSNQLPQHGDAVWVQINITGEVTRIIRRNGNSSPGNNWKKGWVCVTGANINGKKYERVFIEDNNNLKINVTEPIKALWRELITNYQETHIKDVEKRRDRNPPQSPQDYLGHKPGDTAWSRHIYTESEKELREGTLCYVELQGNQVTGLMPVTISRRLYNIAPEKLLDLSLHPATDMSQLSPADRVFGWVNQKGKGAYKGNLRISTVQCNTDDAIEPFSEPGVPLAILGQPKPQQARFYVAQDPKGTPLAANTGKQSGYLSNYGLRGRKVYPHHQDLPSNYWDNPTQDRTQIENNHHFQEYRRPKLRNVEQRDDQNRSILGWVKPSVQFSFEIDVTNLSDVELGALVWLLSLSENYHHHLGGGKPLGFGSVHLVINWQQSDLRQGQDWQQFYSDLLSNDNAKNEQARFTVETFKQQLTAAYSSGNQFDQIPFIKAFCVAAQGFTDGNPIHYPRLTPELNPNGEAFKWFVENERTNGLKMSLPELASDRGLPFKPSI
ncbi:protein of unknown function DUF324 [Crinalium epipsammum PCC 9333]|uniref:CRISPR type III-associated protein domain-containing protein n=1 Tax=Crinalium epipsammum PCC 9333 TaxID=1173022 RepID=K9VVG1_9CYAN|nr:TIGR03986 family CRISPR-associated RAMP protein [Crinalium epipsammum]AFZ11529.1 protein of unknown function DUF324 [Crinalium epipsammum PCC 9333]